MSLIDIAALMHREDVGAVGVEERGRLTGIVTERDLVRAMERGLPARTTTAAQCMTSSPMTVRPDDSLTRAAQLMAAMRVRHLPVVVDDRLVGFLSLRDLVD
jgi:CBS domain-containing protein